MKKNNYIVRTMTRPELDLAVDWAADEGWNPGLNDADCFYNTDPQGFFLGELDGKPIGCISCVAFDPTFGFLGFYIVRPDFRGQGYGRPLWNAALEYIGLRNIGLDGVLEQQEYYKKSGFRLAYRNIRYEGKGAGGKTVSTDIVNLSAVPFPDVVAYDAELFPVARPQFLMPWLRQPEGAALGIIKNGRLAGYGVLRACRKGFKIGPLFADDERSADDLFLALISHVPEAAVYLDVPEANPAAVSLAELYGMKPVFETARMYTQEPPAIPLRRIFGVTSFELG